MSMPVGMPCAIVHEGRERSGRIELHQTCRVVYRVPYVMCSESCRE